MTDPLIIKTISTVTKRGSREWVVSIPKAEHDKAKKLYGKKVKVVIEEIIV